MPYIGRSLGDGVRARYIYAATSGQTTFSGNDANGIALAYSDTLYMDVYQNGVLLKPVTDYASTTGTSVVLVTGASTDDVVEMIVYDSFAVADTVSAANGGTFSGTVATNGGISNSSDLTVDVAGDINLDAGGGDINFKDDGTTVGYLSNSSTDLLLGVSTSDKDLYVQGNDGGSTINALQLDMSSGGYAVFNNGGSFASSLSAPSVFGKTDTDTGIAFDNGTNILQLYTANAEQARIDASGNFGIGGSPSYKLHVQSGDTNSTMRITNTGSTDANVNSIFQLATASNVAQSLVNEASNYSQFSHSGDLIAHYDDVNTHYFRTKAGTEKARIKEKGDILSNFSNADGTFTGVFSNVSTQTLADEAYFTIYPASTGTAGGGLLAIYETASGHSALFHFGYNRSTLVSGSTSYFSTSDTDGYSCAIASGHNLYIKNRRGSSITYATCLHTAGFS